MNDEVKGLLLEALLHENTNHRNRKIIFWYDPNKVYTELIEELTNDTNIKDTEIIKYCDNSNWIRYHIEKEDPNKNIIVYLPINKPDNRDNYLLDLQSYNADYIFNPDSTTMTLKGLGLNEDCRDAVKRNEKFFNNQKREVKFREFEIDKTKENIDFIIMSIILGIKSIKIEDILKSIIVAYYDKEKSIDELLKFSDSDKLLESINQTFGSSIKSFDEIETLFNSLVFTYFASSIQINDEIKRYSKYLLEKKTNSYVFINDLMRDKSTQKYFEIISEKVEKEFGINELLINMTMEEYNDSDAFISIDKHIIASLKETLLSNANQFNSYKSYISLRKNKYWYIHLNKEYEVLNNAIKFLEEYEENIESIRNIDINDFAKQYAESLSNIDRYYRKFYYFYDLLNEKDQFMELKEKIENIYVNKYIQELSIKWSESLSEIKRYDSTKILLQNQFYNEYLKPYSDKKDRIIVVISDAFRYECASELNTQLNTVLGKSTLDFMFGLVPSYTKLGMASLLPHQKLSRGEKDEIIVDGMNSSSLEDRQKILQKEDENSIALKYEDLYNVTKQDWKSLFSGKKYIYVYHNAIDAIGDHSATEKDVFIAVQKAIDEIKKLIDDLHKTFSGTNVFVTADHGFFYKRGKLLDHDKVEKNKEAEIQKSRYSYSDSKENKEGILSISLDYIFGENSGYVNVPKGSMVYQRQGTGLNFVHGGIMPQEIIVPVISFKSARGKDEVKKVSIAYSGISSKITNAITYLTFLQTEKVDDTTKSCRYLLHFEDNKGERVSDQCTIVAEYTDENVKSRVFEEKFVFKNMEYDKEKTYFLVITDEETQIVKEKIKFYIDIAIVNNFGF